MYRKNVIKGTGLRRNESTEGSSMEEQIERIMNNKETVTEAVPIIFTEKKEGVNAAYNIRTDRWEIAIDGIDAINKSYQAKAENRAKMEVVKDEKSDKPSQQNGSDPVA